MSEVVKVPESKHEFEANKNNNDKGKQMSTNYLKTLISAMIRAC